MTLKVATIVGTRPELIRLARVIARLDACMDHRLVHTGQNYDYELNRIFFDDLGIRAPDHFLDAAGANAAETVANVISRAHTWLEQERPEAILILGDTNSAMAAYAAKRLKIPVFHMEAGNRCFDERVPEEINRRIVDHISDINLPYSERAREHLIREGLPPDRVIKTGSPLHEVLEHYRPRIDASDVLSRLGLQAGGYFVASAHREENVDDPARLIKLAELLDAVAERHGLPVILSTHPRTQARLTAAGIKFGERVRALKPLGFFDYIQLQQHARAVLSDSGTLTEEAALLGLRAINLRDTHERMEGMEEGAAVMTGLSQRRVLEALDMVASAPAVPRPVADYLAEGVAEKVARIIQSYTDYVNRVVWRDASLD
ncbi:MAG: UDP-N-acetyl glucosamine 2-epimerase [Betaproteobacteria bacterium]|nr:UDP-N-acetyl glucosamine 2-epimerase [Betaproteobacteria bacterium]